MNFSEHKVKKIILLPEQALHKIKLWCAYQERSQKETRNKLYDYGLHSEEVEQIIATLIAENFLNEERFATAFAGGKFRIKHWGRIKIKLELKRHDVSPRNIDAALKGIDDKDYIKTLRRLLEKKIAAAKGGDRRKAFYTSLNYALSRGFEADLATEELNNLLDKK